MAVDTGPIDFISGTGSRTFTLGVTPTWMQIFFKGPTIKDSQGFIANSHQTCYPAPNEALNTSKAIQVKDTSGTVVFEGTWTSFASSQVTFNITTNTIGTIRANTIFG